MLSLCCAALARTTAYQEALLKGPAQSVAWGSKETLPSSSSGERVMAGGTHRRSHGECITHTEEPRSAVKPMQGAPRDLPNVPEEKCCFGIASDPILPQNHITAVETSQVETSMPSVCSPKSCSLSGRIRNHGRGRGGWWKKKTTQPPNHAGLSHSKLPRRLARHLSCKF